MLAVSYNISEKKAEHNRMIEGCLYPKKQQICQKKNDGIGMDLKDFLGALKIYPSIHDTVNVFSLWHTEMLHDKCFFSELFFYFVVLQSSFIPFLLQMFCLLFVYVFCLPLSCIPFTQLE